VPQGARTLTRFVPGEQIDRNGQAGVTGATVQKMMVRNSLDRDHSIGAPCLYDQGRAVLARIAPPIEG
jgi:hypothetical protein